MLILAAFAYEPQATQISPQGTENPSGEMLSQVRREDTVLVCRKRCIFDVALPDVQLQSRGEGGPSQGMSILRFSWQLPAIERCRQRSQMVHLVSAIREDRGEL